MTSLAGVLGHPAGHSISPQLFSYLSRTSGVSIEYRRLDVPPARLRETIRVMRELDLFVGCNVTIPHKERIAEMVDERSDEAELLGAVNVVHFRDGAMLGYNTDVRGVSATLERRGIEVRGRDGVIFGAGGAALATGYELGARHARSVTIVNRTPARARKIARRLSARFPGTAFEVEARAPDEGIALYVNATPLGMAGFPAHSVLPERVTAGAWAFDLIYRPAKTPFLEDARRRGLRTVGGLDMLIGQGIATFRIWFASRREARTIDTPETLAGLRAHLRRSIA